MRYLLFAGDDYYPQGGAADLVCTLASVDDALPQLEGLGESGGWGHVWDSETEEIVIGFFRKPAWTNPDTTAWQQEED